MAASRSDESLHITIRISDPEEKAKFFNLMEQVGMTNRSQFIRMRIFSEDFRVAKISKDSTIIAEQLAKITAAIRKIGVNYNQAVKAINQYHSEVKAEQMLSKLTINSVALARLLKQAIDLVNQYRAAV